MVYKVTTLKDLPGIPAGSQFRYDKSWGEEPKLSNLNEDSPDVLTPGNIMFLIWDVIVSNPDGWVTNLSVMNLPTSNAPIAVKHRAFFISINPKPREANLSQQ